jgi:hypothetical protein
VHRRKHRRRELADAVFAWRSEIGGWKLSGWKGALLSRRNILGSVMLRALLRARAFRAKQVKKPVSNWRRTGLFDALPPGLQFRGPNVDEAECS